MRTILVISAHLLGVSASAAMPYTVGELKPLCSIYSQKEVSYEEEQAAERCGLQVMDWLMRQGIEPKHPLIICGSRLIEKSRRPNETVTVLLNRSFKKACVTN